MLSKRIKFSEMAMLDTWNPTPPLHVSQSGVCNEPSIRSILAGTGKRAPLLRKRKAN